MCCRKHCTRRSRRHDCRRGLRAIGQLKATITRIDLAQAPTCQLAGRPEMCASCKVQAVRADVITDIAEMIDDADNYLRDLEHVHAPPAFTVLEVEVAEKTPKTPEVETPEAPAHKTPNAEEGEEYELSFLKSPCFDLRVIIYSARVSQRRRFITTSLSRVNPPCQ
jgi:hypothetical protein